MYLHIGQATVLKASDIVGFFDLDTATIKKTTRDFLGATEKTLHVFSVAPDLPKSFIVCSVDRSYKVYLTPLNTSTILKRLSEFRDTGIKIKNMEG